MSQTIHGHKLPQSAPAIEAPRLNSLSERSCVEYVSIQCAHCDARLEYNFSESDEELKELDYRRDQEGWDYTPAGLACPKHCVDETRARVIR